MNRKRGTGRGRLVAALAIVTTLGIAGIASAQTGSSTIAGVVKDDSGGAVPGVSVRVVNEGTGVAAERFSDEQGAFSVDALLPGQYQLEATLDGFETVVRQVVLAAGQTESIDVTLTPARFTEGVVVTARRVEEVAQEVPIPVSVVSGDLVADAGAFNVNRLKEMIPTVHP